jgi:U3 small nucleolar RNA-associated protein 20
VLLWTFLSGKLLGFSRGQYSEVLRTVLLPFFVHVMSFLICVFYVAFLSKFLDDWIWVVNHALFNNINKSVALDLGVNDCNPVEIAYCICGLVQGALLRIFVPLFMNPIVEATGDKEGNLVGSAIETIACIAKQLQWEPYFGLLMRSFRFLSTKVEHQKALIRLVCATLDAFHFFKAPTSVGVEEGGKSSNVAMDTGEDDATNPTSVDDSTRAVAPDIETLLQKRVLPEFTKLMVSKMDIVNASVALALVKILKLMPEEVAEVELPRIVQSITNLLKNRNSQAVRDEARAALVSVAGTLGPRYLHFIVGVLKASLTKGFEVHVLGYTINSIIVKLVEIVKVGDIDYCLVQLLEVLENDIMGEVAEEKNVEAIAGKMKETKHMQSFESMRLISQVITFPTQIPVMLGPIRRNLPKSLVPKNRVKVEMMLKQIGLGLQVNPSVTQENLFVLVHALVEDGLKEENAVALALAAKNQSKVDGTGNTRLSLKVTGKAPELNRSKGDDESLKDVRGLTANAHLLTEFAFQLFHTHMKKVKIGFQDQQTLSMLDPLVGLFSKCLTSKYDGVLSGVMRCLSILVRLPLPSIDTNGNQMSTLVFTMAQQSGKTDTPVMQACFQLLVILIRHCKTANISEDRLRLLLQFPVFADLEGTSGNTAIALLKAVVSRKLLVPELYDMMAQVSKLMIQSQMPPVRQACSQVFLQFLLDYPLGPKRLQQHLDFLLTNLG